MHSLRPLLSTLLVLSACGDSGAAPATDTGTGEPASTGEPATSEPTTSEPTTADTTSTGEPATSEPTTADTTSTGEPATGESTDSTTGEPDPFLEGAPTPNVGPGEQDVDVFGTLGVRYWFAVDPEEVTRMNNAGNEQPDIYTPGNSATYADHLFVSTPGATPQIADYGKVETRVVGQSTFRPWTATTIPSLKIDTDEFTDGLEVGGVEHLRFNNSLVGTIFRERLALTMYAKLGYPAPRTTHAWVGSNVWGPGVQIPYTVVEVYKRDFCEHNADKLGGGCSNMWEFVGDLNVDVLAHSDSCQLSECTADRAIEFTDAVLATPSGPGYKAALADYVAWDEFHRFQCISWLLWTGDDVLHNQNNVVLVERLDGRFQYLPYSVDISAGQEWYKDVPLYGVTQLALGCQSDPDCWKDTISTCEDVVAEFVASKPVALVDALNEELDAEGMLRDGDDSRYKQVRGWYADRVANALADLDKFRDQPCSPETIKCDGACVDPQECVLTCKPGSAQCGPICVPDGECFVCDWPFEPCGDNTCKPQGQC
jgi:hypothetical protein